MTNPADLMTEARKHTGLEDFGPGDFAEGLGVYCESVWSEAELNHVGAVAVPQLIVASLANRLRVVDWAARNPDVAAERIDEPLIVIGMFRAGTTFLSNLLDQDGRNRPLLRWEAADSVPPPSPDTFRSGPRVDAARASGDVLEQVNPKMAAIHHEEADGPTECVSVMRQDFKSLLWEAITNVPAYGRWLQEVDQSSAYRYHRLVLQVLQHGGVRGRWTLKSPHHAIALEALTAVYPDAHLVLLHRDPVVLCGSVCSLIHNLSGTFSDSDHDRYIGEHWTAMLELSVDRIAAFRAAHPHHPVLDVQYADLMRDPVDTVAHIYAYAGERLADDARAAMESYVAAIRQARTRVHHYCLADVGLDEGGVAERFSSYVSRYQIPVEH
jgi:hypothetical protein